MATQFKTPYRPREDEVSWSNSEATLPSLPAYDQTPSPVPPIPSFSPLPSANLVASMPPWPEAPYVVPTPDGTVTGYTPIVTGQREVNDAPYGLLASLVLAGLVGAAMIANWAHNPGNEDLNAALASGMRIYAMPQVASVAAFLNRLVTPVGILFSATLLTGCLFLLRRPVQAVTLLVSGVGGVLVTWALHALVPRLGLIELAVPAGINAAHAFPSAQAVYLVTCCLPLIWFLCEKQPGSRGDAFSGMLRGCLRLALLLTPFAGGIAQVAFGAAWPSDVFAGYAVGTFWAGAVLLAYVRVRKGSTSRA